MCEFCGTGPTCCVCGRGRADPDLLIVLRDLFKHCAMVHKNWGDGCNRKEADAAISAGRAALREAGAV